MQQESASLNGLGYLYYHGLGVKHDMLKAYDYFGRALLKDEKNPDIAFNIGLVRNVAVRSVRLVDEA